MQTGALIAAAGKPGAMEEFRPLMRLSGTSLIQKEIDTLRRAGVSPIVVVTGYEAESLERHLAHRGVVCLRNENYEHGEMLDSVKLGLEWLQSRCDAVLFLPADAPLFSAASVEAVIASRAKIAVPVYDGKAGHPIRIRRSVIPAVLSYEGDFGLRGALAVSGAETERVEVPDPGVLLEVNDPEQYREVLDYERRTIAEQRLTCRVEVTLGRETPFFDRSVAEFLCRIDEKGSMLAACKELGMSYSKGWKRVKAIEEGMGFPFLERRTGGADGGNSRLTKEGREFLDAFLAIQEDVTRSTNAFFHLHFGDKY